MSDSAWNAWMLWIISALAVLILFQHHRIKALETAMEQVQAYEEITSSGRTQRLVPGGP
jgi:hypothetical protein